MSDRTPFYKRTLDSFADHIITRARAYSDGFHAVLDCGFDTYVGDPDFSPHGYGKTMEEAARRSSAAIRNDALGIGKYAPHSLLVPGYDLHFRLMKHWDMKERLEKLGIDPNEAFRVADSENLSNWELKGEFINVCKERRLLEFVFGLHVAEVVAEVRAGEIELDAARDEVVKRLKAHLEDARHRSTPTEATWQHMDQRIEEYMAHNLALAPAP
jgi:antitoxin (DNA-binding transcriptional repressor) of toxin-antitoxin stability system